MGNNLDTLLWPNRNAMKAIFALRHANPLSSNSPNIPIALEDKSSTQLLWPDALIHKLAQRRSEHNFALPLAITTFILAAILGLAIGPTQLILMATTTDYAWVTNAYYPSALKCVLLISSFVALLSLGTLILAWRAQAEKARLVCVLAAGSLMEILAIWLFGGITALPPHHLTVALIAIVLIFILISLFVSKQYSATTQLSPALQISLTMFSVLSVVCVIIGPLYLSQTSSQVDSAEIAQLAANQAQARVDGVPERLSDLTFTICNGKYQVIYLDDSVASGVFECAETHEVYSITDSALPTVNSVRGLAMYLGTTQDPAISRTFPTSYYLYHHLPDMSEAELALIVPAYSETELVDNLVQPVLNYWQTHNTTNLFLNIFYANSLQDIETTSDYVLLAALGTISMSDQLPRGNTISGYYNGTIVDYIFQPDIELLALNNFGANPSLYPAIIREALRTNRHISIHLQAGQEYDFDSMRELLQNSFVTPE